MQTITEQQGKFAQDKKGIHMKLPGFFEHHLENTAGDIKSKSLNQSKSEV